MQTNEEELSLSNVRGGAIDEAFRFRVMEILKNIKDPNTTDEKREINLKITLTPDADRQFVKIDYAFKTKIAPDKAITTHAAIGANGSQFVLHELSRHEQVPMFGNNVRPIEGRQR